MGSDQFKRIILAQIIAQEMHSLLILPHGTFLQEYLKLQTWNIKIEILQATHLTRPCVTRVTPG